MRAKQASVAHNATPPVLCVPDVRYAGSRLLRGTAQANVPPQSAAFLALSDRPVGSPDEKMIFFGIILQNPLDFLREIVYNNI